MNLKQRYDREVSRLRASDEEDQAIELALAVGAAIRQRMATQGVSQADLARELRVSPAHISKLLSARTRNLTLRTLARLAAALDAEVAWDFRPLRGESRPGTVRRRWLCEVSGVHTKSKESGHAALSLAA